VTEMGQGKSRDIFFMETETKIIEEQGSLYTTE
jgi:hypothetical protein